MDYIFTFFGKIREEKLIHASAFTYEHGYQGKLFQSRVCKFDYRILQGFILGVWCGKFQGFETYV